MAGPPLLMKQLLAVIDDRTTVICLRAAGQIVPVDDPFETLNGEFMTPPFHVHCRDTVVPWLPGFVSTIRQEANAELQRRPAKERRYGVGGSTARRVPLPEEGPRLPYVAPGAVDPAAAARRAGPGVPSPTEFAASLRAEAGLLAPEEKSRANMLRRVARAVVKMDLSEADLLAVMAMLSRRRWARFADLPEWFRRKVRATERV